MVTMVISQYERSNHCKYLAITTKKDVLHCFSRL